MSILFLLREHGNLTFEDMVNIVGSSTDEVELMSRLKNLEAEGKIHSFINNEDVREYCIKDTLNVIRGIEIIDSLS